MLTEQPNRWPMGRTLGPLRTKEGGGEGQGVSMLNQNALTSEVGLMRTPRGDCGSQQPGMPSREGGADHRPSIFGVPSAPSPALRTPLMVPEGPTCLSISKKRQERGGWNSRDLAPPTGKACASSLQAHVDGHTGPLFSRGK